MMNLTLGNDDGDDEDSDNPGMIEERKSELDEDSEHLNDQWAVSQENADRILAFEPINNNEDRSPEGQEAQRLENP